MTAEPLQLETRISRLMAIPTSRSHVHREQRRTTDLVYLSPVDEERLRGLITDGAGPDTSAGTDRSSPDCG